jgi:hypothetical protein
LAARSRFSRPAAAFVVAFLVFVAVGVLQLAQGQNFDRYEGRGSRSSSVGEPEAEFHMARMIYSSGDGFRAFRPWWAIDYPEAEYHFRQGVRRLTRIDMADDSRHIELTDDALFDYPWLFAQQVGRWSLSDAETSRLREYLLRGGFMVADDFHGPWQWDVFAEVMARVFRTVRSSISPTATRSCTCSTTSTSARRFRAAA